MLSYYLDLAIRSFRRNVSLTVLMVLAIAFGVGASMTTLTVLRVTSRDPLPGKSQDVYRVQLDPVNKREYTPGAEPPEELTRYDAEELMRARRADRQVMMTGGAAAIDPAREDLDPFFVNARWSSADFFPMFRVPFLAGAGWSDLEDTTAARVAVISRELAEKLYGGVDAVGKTVRVDGTEMQIVGVMDRWRAIPHFYDLSTGSYSPAEQLFVPLSTALELDLNNNGNMNCWDQAEDQRARGAPCMFLEFWVELDSADKATAYRDFLVGYSEEQRAAGRYDRPPNVRLRNVMDYLAHNEVVPSDVRLQNWVALGFLLVCLINTVGLLLTKFLRRSADIGVRRALGASKRSIFFQLLVESGVIGLAGGVLGLGLAWLGLWAVRQQPASYAELAELDSTMLATTFVLAIASSLLAGVLPAWRGCQVTPAIQLKSH